MTTEGADLVFVRDGDRLRVVSRERLARQLLTENRGAPTGRVQECDKEIEPDAVTERDGIATLNRS